MNVLTFVFVLAATTVDLGIVTVPLAGEIRPVLTPAARCQIKLEGSVTRIRIEIDRIALPSTFGPMYNTYVVWAISPEGILDNLGELEIRGNKGEFNATTRLTQFGILISAEPHYMVDRPSEAVAHRSQSAETDIRRRVAPIELGVYDYSQLKPVSTTGVHNTVVQARTAFSIAQSSGADRLAPADFRNAQVLLGSLEELINRAAPLDIIWPAANEAIRASQRAAAAARSAR
jgi:hypothetical protein